MTSRRPMTRSYSGNGRTSSFSEEESSSSNGRNTYLSNVRPENRSTLCSVMAQLTEDVQPSFETTLKSKAVSENCNVKFTCVVSGLPAPELKWYKDDLELDRYCGLPKYEIRRNGKTHTLHIYNCTLDDAAIYQVSASNSKGIVSCSGVLEVGTMSEYQIHQRFFAKLKAKAEKKRQDLEESSKKAAADKEPAPKETPQKSPERTPRKRAISEPSQSPEELLVGAAEKNSQVQEPAPTSPVAPEVKTDGEHALSKKKFKISNSVDAQTEQPSTPKGNTVRSNVMGNGGDNHYDGGMGLAQFLAETLQSQAAEEKQVPNKEEAGKGGGESVKEKTHEEDGKQTVEEEMEVETVQVQAQAQVQERAEQEMKEESKEKAHPTPPIRHKKEHKEQKEQKEHKEHKEHKDHHIPASISSMLHSVKDFFFGKNKKEPHESKPKDTPDSPGVLEPPATPPSYYLKPESLSETRAKDDYGMPTEVAQLQGATSERPKVAEEQEDLCRGETAPESTAGGGADQAMEVTEEETALSSPQILAETVEKEDRILNISDIKSEDRISVPELPPKDPVPAPEQPPVQLPTPSPSSFQRHHTQSPCEDSPDSPPQPEQRRNQNPVAEIQPQQTQNDTDTRSSRDFALATSVFPSVLEEEKTTQHQVLLVPDRDAKTKESGELNSSVVEEMSVEFPAPVSNSELNTQTHLPEMNKESENANILQEKQNNEDQEATKESQIPIENIPLIQISSIEDTQEVEAAMCTGNIQDNSESLPVTKPILTGFEHDVKTVPEIHICSTEEIPEVQVVVPVICVEDEILTPTIEITQPDVIEGPVPILNLPKENEPAVSQKEFDNWPNIIIQNDYVSDFCMQLEPEKAEAQTEELPQVHYPIIPIINVSCTEEGMEQVSEIRPSLETVELPVCAPVLVVQTAESGDTREQELSEQKEKSEPREETKVVEKVEPIESAGAGHGDTTAHVETAELREVPVSEQICERSELGELIKHKETLEIQRETPEHRETEPAASAVSEAAVRESGAASQEEPKLSEAQTQGEVQEQSGAENRLTVAYETPKTDVNVLSLSKTVEASIESEITQSLKEARIESFMSVERLSFKPPLYPSLSPASLRKFMKASGEADSAGDRQSDKAEDSLSGGSTPTSSLSCESSPRLKRRDSLSLIRSATPEELASGARRKIYIPKTKEESEDSSAKKDSPYMSPGQARRTTYLQPPSGSNTPPVERRSPLLNRRKATLEVPKVVEEIPVPEEVSTKREEKPGDKKPDPLKAPQVIRKIRGEPFPDASGHLKLWCQFFNVLSDSTIKWYKEEQEILEVQRSGGDETQVALAIVLASSLDCGVYGCSIKNEYGSDTTDFLLSEDVMAEILLKDDLEVGEEIEMTPLLFNRGLADSGTWGGKFFGRIMTETVHLGEGWTHKTSRVKVIYGLEPIFESGTSCIMKIQNPIPYGTKLESNLAERNQEITKQECKVQNMIREYCKIFTAESRVNENFGSALEVVPQYLMYRPANSVPYATVEAELQGPFQAYCWVDSGKLNSKGGSEVEQKCCTFQHWLYEWTHSNLLPTRLEGVDFKITNIRVATKSKGYQGLSERGSPEVFDQFITHHQCNYYCGLLGLRPLKSMDSLQPPSKMKGSRSPLLNRKMSVGSGSPHMPKKASLSPHSQRKAGTSPKAPRKNQEAEDSKSKAVESR